MGHCHNRRQNSRCFWSKIYWWSSIRTQQIYTKRTRKQLNMSCRNRKVTNIGLFRWTVNWLKLLVRGRLKMRPKLPSFCLSIILGSLICLLWSLLVPLVNKVSNLKNSRRQSYLLVLKSKKISARIKTNCSSPK